MYTISAASSKIEKDFKKLLSAMSEKQQKNMFTVLAKSPKATQSNNDTLNKVEKKGKLWQYYATGGDRVIYDIIETVEYKTVLIFFAGNHDAAATYLRKNR